MKMDEVQGEILDNQTQAPGARATADEVRQAIENLTPAQTARLIKVATIAIWGSEYTSPQELMNEAVARALSGALGAPGRGWPRSVPFMAFMINTMRGIANDSSESHAQSRTERYSAMAAEGSEEDLLGSLGHFHPSAEQDATERQEKTLREARAKEDCVVIETHFADDQVVSAVIMCIKDDMRVSDILAFAEINKTQYDTARTKIRRAVEKLFPGRRQK
jgi:hypothetical protein